MNLRLRPGLLCVVHRCGLLSSPGAGTEHGACCSRRLLVGVGDFRDIAVMAADRLQWEKKGRRRFGNWFRIDFRQDGIPATPYCTGDGNRIPAKSLERRGAKTMPA